jgi:hypothetical protein
VLCQCRVTGTTKEYATHSFTLMLKSSQGPYAGPQGLIMTLINVNLEGRQGVQPGCDISPVRL